MSLINFRSNPDYTSLVRAKGQHEIPDHVAEFFSDHSLEVMVEFGWETPILLNRYACALEDEILALQKENTRLRGEAVLSDIRKEAKQEKKSKGKKKSKRFNKKNKM